MERSVNIGAKMWLVPAVAAILNLLPVIWLCYRLAEPQALLHASKTIRLPQAIGARRLLSALSELRKDETALLARDASMPYTAISTEDITRISLAALRHQQRQYDTWLDPHLPPATTLRAYVALHERFVYLYRSRQIQEAEDLLFGKMKKQYLVARDALTKKSRRSFSAIEHALDAGKTLTRDCLIWLGVATLVSAGVIAIAVYAFSTLKYRRPPSNSHPLDFERLLDIFPTQPPSEDIRREAETALLALQRISRRLSLLGHEASNPQSHPNQHTTLTHMIDEARKAGEELEKIGLSLGKIYPPVASKEK